MATSRKLSESAEPCLLRMLQVIGLDFSLFGPTSSKDSSAQTRSMSTFCPALGHPFSQHVCFMTLSSLLQALFTRPMRSFQGHCTQDPDEGLKLHSQCVNNGHASLPDQLWAYVA